MTHRTHDTWKATLRVTLSSLLKRSRLSLPCPVSFEAVYKSAFPGSVVIQSMCRKDGLAQFGRDMGRANLMRCTTTSSLVTFTLHAPSDLVSNDTQMYFWMRVPWRQDLIAPPLGGSLFISPEMRTNKQLLDWQAKCFAMDETIERHTFRLYEFARLIENRLERDTLWPELGKMIRFDDGPPVQLSLPMARHKLHRMKNLKQTFDVLISPEIKQEIEEMLAAAVLLPEAELMSWAGDPTLEKL